MVAFTSGLLPRFRAAGGVLAARLGERLRRVSLPRVAVVFFRVPFFAQGEFSVGRPLDEIERLTELASYLAARHEEILQAWREAAEADPEMVTASVVSLTHFRDLIPDILRAYERELRTGLAEAAEEEKETEIADHGLHRWQQGYSLRELIREWGHLELCVLDELERYQAGHPEAGHDAMAAARRSWVRLCGEGMCKSAERYARLKETEAAGHVRDLQEALELLRALESQRAAVWYEAAHDLRGNVGLVTATTSILNEEGVPERLRTKAVSVLQNSAAVLHQMLEDLLSLARLEAGRERRNVEPFDAASLLRELCATLEPVAAERELYLRTEGPETLPVEGDAVKVQRIVQNLTLNALKYTVRGGVTVAWGESWETDVDRWIIRVRDTGPGLATAPGSPIADELRQATRGAWETEQKPAGRGESGGQREPALPPSPADTVPFPQQPGEGIGLSIVKRLCELLEASLEVASNSAGTTFQIVLPRRYEKG
jgi:signal transduction histidine kinase